MDSCDWSTKCEWLYPQKVFYFSQVLNSVLVALSVVETFFRDKIEKNLFMSTTVVEKTTTCLQANFL